jgi:hypothetical protein
VPLCQCELLFKVDLSYFQAGISAVPTRAISAVKNMNIPQPFKEMKLPELPQAIMNVMGPFDR